MPKPDETPIAMRVAEGRRWLDATVCRAGADLVVTVRGGERPHVGCVVVAIASDSAGRPDARRVATSLVTIPMHREEALARPLAERLARELGGVVVVAAGVHDDGLDADGIATYLRLGAQLADEILAALGS
ncbi:MAG TPA: hypothetical protein VLW17_07025 [Thermoanaerobaculaceae bacterium]|nr:hypothetical protein [Thermoanaerobaculaceae bacterium]